MIKKVLQYIILGLTIYASIVILVINFYKDDPQAMIWQDREAFNNRFISKLDQSEVIPLEEVLEILGSPDLTYVVKHKGDVFQIVYYRTQLIKSDGITTQDECTGLLFKNGNLLVWGENATLEYTNISGE
jgi:hypothetical protein